MTFTTDELVAMIESARRLKDEHWADDAKTNPFMTAKSEGFDFAADMILRRIRLGQSSALRKRLGFDVGDMDGDKAE